MNLESPAFIQIDLRRNDGSVCTELADTRATPSTPISSVLLLPNDLDTSEYMFSRSLIVHELLHALGIQGHVDSIEFPDSIMGSEGEHIPNVGHIISKIDKEVLQIMYMNQRNRTLQRLGRMVGYQLPLGGPDGRRDPELRRGAVQRTAATVGAWHPAEYVFGRQ